MAMTGIICEYNPLHRGHGKQIAHIKAAYPDDGVVCLMSGCFVQRGQPAIFSPAVRANAAVLAGADLVLELPTTVSLSSAEGFAHGGVEILHRLGVNRLCFGSERGEILPLLETARALLSPDFPELLRQALDDGVSFPTARCRAAAALGADPAVLSRPNDILAVEYAKAVLALNSPMELMPIHRAGDYHAPEADAENPSATALRALILAGKDWLSLVPEAARPAFHGATVHSLSFGERAILGKLRDMEDAAFAALPYGSEGLWRKLMRESRRQRTLEDIFAAVKSKRYTRSRLDRMVMCAFLGLSAENMEEKAPYVRILACSGRGRTMLRQMEQGEYLVNQGKTMDGPWACREARIRRLYGLFAAETEPPQQDERIVIHP